MGFPQKTHDPDAYLDYPQDWTKWLVGDDVLETVQVIADPVVTVAASAVAPGGQICYAWLSLDNPEPNGKYDVTYRITTAEGRIDDRSFTLVCKER